MANERDKQFHYGGQAVIEGVMMRGKKHFAVACRRANGEVEITSEHIEGTILGKLKWLNKPFLRGTLAMVDSLALGMKSLMWSANIALQDEQARIESEKREKSSAAGETPAAKASPPKSKQISNATAALSLVAWLALAIVFFVYALPLLTQLIGMHVTDNHAYLGWLRAGIKFMFVIVSVLAISKIWNMRQAAHPENANKVNDITLNITLCISIVIALVVFMYIPPLLTRLATQSVHLTNRISLGLIEGAIKLTFFFTYIWAISKMKDIRRVFQYHGAEHKTINAYEAGEELTVENVQRHTTVHVRCGTSFLMVVILTSIVVFIAIPWQFKDLPIWQAILLRFAWKLPLLPIVAGIAYEVIKFAGSRKKSKVVPFLLGPGLLMQRLTTQPPTDDMVEVAIKSFQGVRAAEAESSGPHSSILNPQS